MAFSRTWNATYEGSPADTDQAKQGALRIREVKQDVRERAEVDHFWQDDTHGGKHKQVRMRELTSDPTSAADEGVLYVKDDGGGRTELYYIDSAGAITRITTAGTIPVTDGSVTTAKLADGAVTTPKLADGAVTLAKLASDSVDQAKIVAAAVGQGELKTTTGDVTVDMPGGTGRSTGALPGGSYGLRAQVFRASGSGTPSVTSFSSPDLTSTTPVSLRVNFTNSAGTSCVAAVRERYVQGSPPYMPFRENDPVPLFIFARMSKTTQEITQTYVAEDPPWANHGPTVINPLGRLTALARSRLPQGRENDLDAWADLYDWLYDPKNADAIRKELKRPISQEEKNRDMPLIPHPFFNIDPAEEVVLLLSPTDSRLCRALHARFIFGGDSISTLLHEGYFEIDNTPMPGLNTPFNVMAVSCRLKNNGKR